MTARENRLVLQLEKFGFGVKKVTEGRCSGIFFSGSLWKRIDYLFVRGGLLWSRLFFSISSISTYDMFCWQKDKASLLHLHKKWVIVVFTWGKRMYVLGTPAAPWVFLLCSLGGKRESSPIFILEGRNSNNFSIREKRSIEAVRLEKQWAQTTHNNMDCCLITKKMWNVGGVENELRVRRL